MSRPGGAQVTLRPVTPADEAFLRRVYASSRADELAAVAWTQAQREAFCDLQFEAQRTDYLRRFPDSEHAVVLADGEPAGRVWVDANTDEVRLLDVTILPEHQGKGIGTTLLRRLQERARTAGVPLRHTVLTSNVGALRLYERVGFAVKDSTQTHHLMEWTAR
jgi:ribosomal protein S18 acetylase RimI-like enzyme